MNESGRFKVGNPGRPPGVPALEKELRAMLAEDAEAFRRVAREKMLDGDSRFWEMLLRRAWPEKLELGLSQGEGGPLELTWAKGEDDE